LHIGRGLKEKEGGGQGGKRKGWGKEVVLIFPERDLWKALAMRIDIRGGKKEKEKKEGGRGGVIACCLPFRRHRGRGRDGRKIKGKMSPLCSSYCYPLGCFPRREEGERKRRGGKKEEKKRRGSKVQMLSLKYIPLQLGHERME